MATVPVEITWTTGQVVTAAQLNSNLRDAINFLLNPPTCELRQTVAQSINSGNTTTTLLLDAEDLDSDNMHSTTSLTSRVTIQTAGRYQITGGVAWSPNSSGRRGSWWFLNGGALVASAAIYPTLSAGNPVVGSRTRQVYANVGDYIELLPFQDCGSALNTAVNNPGAGEMSHVGVRLVRLS